MKVLLADDDADMVDVTAYALRREGFSIVVARDGDQALRCWHADAPDVVLLDVSMPRLGGLEVCRRIRQAAATPIIMLTAAADEEHVVQGFRSGADDYVTKPFSPRQLVLRIRAVVRRSPGPTLPAPSGELVAGDLTLEIEAHRVRRGERVVQLTPREFRLLEILATNLGRVVSSARLVEYAWGDGGTDPSALKTHISHLRTKLGLQRGQTTDIVSVVGVGYRLVAPVEAPEPGMGNFP